MTVGQPQDTVVGAKVRVPRVTALVRERLNHTLDGVWQHGLGLVVAPAGSGKTTALAQFAATVDAPVAWYRPRPPRPATRACSSPTWSAP
jgi:ATP/maltotriose-dependent transcriptional regulator MalT